MLEECVPTEEIKKVIQNTNGDKSPDPDCLNIGFFRVG